MAHGNVEVWLGKLLDMSLRSVNAVIRNAMIAIENPNFELLDFLEAYPAQVIPFDPNYVVIYSVFFNVGWSIGYSSDLDC